MLLFQENNKIITAIAYESSITGHSQKIMKIRASSCADNHHNFNASFIVGEDGWGVSLFR